MGCGVTEKRSKTSREQRKAYLKRKREICIAFGVCRECLARDAEKGLYCTKCYQKMKDRTIPKRELYVELGLCTKCGGKRVDGYKLCERCLESIKIVVANRPKPNISKKRDICVAFGVCVDCMEQDAMEGTTRCAECFAKEAERRKDNREWYKEHGICPECRTNKAMAGRISCVNCSKQDSLKFSQVKGKKKLVTTRQQTLWKDQGLCFQCGGKVVDGYKQCEKHLSISRNNAKLLNEKNKEKHPWVIDSQTTWIKYNSICNKKHDNTG